MNTWKTALKLDKDLSVISGSKEALCEAIKRGADLRIYTEFRHDEHIAPGSENRELVQEVSEFRVTYLIDERWSAGIMTLRMPIIPPEGFGPRPSMSFFMYNQDGTQGIARPMLDGMPASGYTPVSMPKYEEHDRWDDDTNAPSSNFTYHFEQFRYIVRDDWNEVLSHDADGEVVSGSLESLVDAFAGGGELKVGIRGLCADLGNEYDHEVFVHIGPGYYNTETRLFSAGTHPVVRVKPSIPMRYESRYWDFGWLMPRTDGIVFRWICDPYTLKFSKSEKRHPTRWFARV